MRACVRLQTQTLGGFEDDARRWTKRCERPPDTRHCNGRTAASAARRWWTPFVYVFLALINCRVLFFSSVITRHTDTQRDWSHNSSRAAAVCSEWRWKEDIRWFDVNDARYVVSRRPATALHADSAQCDQWRHQTTGDVIRLGYLTGSQRLPGDLLYRTPGKSISGAISLAVDEINANEQVTTPSTWLQFPTRSQRYMRSV